MDSGATCCSWELLLVAFTLPRNSALLWMEPSSLISTTSLSRMESRARVSPALYAWFHAFSSAMILVRTADSESSCACKKQAVVQTTISKQAPILMVRPPPLGIWLAVYGNFLTFLAGRNRLATGRVCGSGVVWVGHSCPTLLTLICSVVTPQPKPKSTASDRSVRPPPVRGLNCKPARRRQVL